MIDGMKWYFSAHIKLGSCVLFDRSCVREIKFLV